MQFLFDESPAPATRNSIELLTFSRSRLTALAAKVDGVNMIAVKLQMEEDDFVPVGLDLGLAPGAEMGIGEEEKGEESTEELRQSVKQWRGTNLDPLHIYLQTRRRRTWRAARRRKRCRRAAT